MSQSATPAMQNNITTCLETFEKERFCSFPHRHGDATGKPQNSRRDKWVQKNEHFVRDVLQFWHFRHVIKQVGMSQSATPATQNNMTTCLETFEKERFCSFPHRHGDATGKPETSRETSSNFDIFDTLSNRLECRKVPRLPRKTTWQPAWKPSKRRGFAASHIDTATPQENHKTRDETSGCRKTSISCETSWNFHTL